MSSQTHDMIYSLEIVLNLNLKYLHDSLDEDVEEAYTEGRYEERFGSEPIREQ